MVWAVSMDSDGTATSKSNSHYLSLQTDLLRVQKKLETDFPPPPKMV